MEPPSYDGFTPEALVSSSHGAQSDLPEYTRRPTPPPAEAIREPKEFSYEIKNRSGTPWAIFSVQGDPMLSKVMPTVAQGSNMVGSVKLDLPSPETIQAICILIRGEIVNSGPGAVSMPFVEIKHTLWSGKSKLEGDYNFPFTVEIPATFSKNGKIYRLPHTYLNRLSILGVKYTAELRIVRGKLRPDDKVACTFGYSSMQQPGPPSQLRKLAYQENSPLFGPNADPEGWHTQTLSVRGKLFASRSIEVKCMFSLATPLSYTRSASIPCAVTIETDDIQALDLLSSPSASIVYLERSINEKRRDLQRIVSETCGQAVFWPSTEGAAVDSVSSNRRQLMGEIHLRGNLQPSSAVPGLVVEYAVIVFPLQAPGFKASEREPLLRQVVEITTRYAAGPRQKTYTSATYETRNAVVDYYYRVNSLSAAAASGFS